jgi:endoglucanase
MANFSLAPNTRLATAALVLTAILGTVAAMAAGTDLLSRLDPAGRGTATRPGPTRPADPSRTLSDLPTADRDGWPGDGWPGDGWPGDGSPGEGVASASATRAPTAPTTGPSGPRTQAPTEASTGPTRPTTRPTTRPVRPSPDGGLSAAWSLDSSWGTAYVAQIAVKAGSARRGWAVSWADPGATSVSLDWGVACQVGSGRVTCRGAGWGRDLKAGRPIKVGAQVQHRGTAPRSPTLRLS